MDEFYANRATLSASMPSHPARPRNSNKRQLKETNKILKGTRHNRHYFFSSFKPFNSSLVILFLSCLYEIHHFNDRERVSCHFTINHFGLVRLTDVGVVMSVSSSGLERKKKHVFTTPLCYPRSFSSNNNTQNDVDFVFPQYSFD